MMQSIRQYNSVLKRANAGARKKAVKELGELRNRPLRLYLGQIYESEENLKNKIVEFKKIKRNKKLQQMTVQQMTKQASLYDRYIALPLISAYVKDSDAEVRRLAAQVLLQIARQTSNKALKNRIKKLNIPSTVFNSNA